tara:strand:+ start:379 stop:537 length:159 start_codon:yes stop_codon:yes gene_type:complete
MADPVKKKAPAKKEKDTSAFKKIMNFVNQDKIIGRIPEGVKRQQKNEKKAGI